MQSEFRESDERNAQPDPFAALGPPPVEPVSIGEAASAVVMRIKSGLPSIKVRSEAGRRKPPIS